MYVALHVPLRIIMQSLLEQETLSNFTEAELNHVIETLDLERQHREQERKEK